MQPGISTFPRQKTQVSLLLAALGLAVLAPLATAEQGTITVKSGDSTVTRQGDILGVTNNQLRVKIPQGEFNIPMDRVVSVDMPAPKAFDEGNELIAAGNYPLALAKFATVQSQYRGLPAPWMAVTLARLGQSYIGLNQFDKAEATFAEYTKIFGTGENVMPLAELGRAQIAFAQDKPAEARELLTPVVEKAATMEAVDEAQSAFFANAFYTLAQIQEAAGDFPSALESYLKVVTLYHKDKTLLASAEAKADALRKAHPEVTVP